MKIDWRSWWRLPQQLRFLVAGGYNTAFGYAVFIALFLAFGRRVHYLVIALVAQAIALVSAYAVHRWLVFRSTESWPVSFYRFCLSQLAAFCVGMAGLYIFVEFARIKPLVAQAIVTVSTVLLSYLLHRYYSFRRHPDARQS